MTTKLFLLLTLIFNLSCGKEEEKSEILDSRTTKMIIECQHELTSFCGSATASANGKTAYVYYLNNNCVTVNPTNGLDITDVSAYTKTTLSCTESNGCSASTTTWYDTDDNVITNPPQPNLMGTRAFVAFIDDNANASDPNGLDGLDTINIDPMSDCSDLSGTETYGNHTLTNFSNN